MRAAALACELGRGAAFVLAAGRLAFCGGFDLGDPEVLAEAAAAAGLPLDACLAAAGDAGRDAAIEDAGRRLVAMGADELPALRVGRRLFDGEERLPEAAAAATAYRLRLARRRSSPTMRAWSARRCGGSTGSWGRSTRGSCSALQYQFAHLVAAGGVGLLALYQDMSGMQFRRILLVSQGLVLIDNVFSLRATFRLLRPADRVAARAPHARHGDRCLARAGRPAARLPAGAALRVDRHQRRPDHRSTSTSSSTRRGSRRS